MPTYPTQIYIVSKQDREEASRKGKSTRDIIREREQAYRQTQTKTRAKAGGGKVQATTRAGEILTALYGVSSEKVQNLAAERVPVVGEARPTGLGTSLSEAEKERAAQQLIKGGYKSGIAPQTMVDLQTGGLKVYRRQKSGELVETTGELRVAGGTLYTRKAATSIRNLEKKEMADQARAAGIPLSVFQDIKEGRLRTFHKAKTGGRVETTASIIATREVSPARALAATPGKTVSNVLAQYKKGTLYTEPAAIKTAEIFESGYPVIKGKIKLPISGIGEGFESGKGGARGSDLGRIGGREVGQGIYGGMGSATNLTPEQREASYINREMIRRATRFDFRSEGPMPEIITRDLKTLEKAEKRHMEGVERVKPTASFLSVLTLANIKAQLKHPGIPITLKEYGELDITGKVQFPETQSTRGERILTSGYTSVMASPQYIALTYKKAVTTGLVAGYSLTTKGGKEAIFSELKAPFVSKEDRYTAFRQSFDIRTEEGQNTFILIGAFAGLRAAGQYSKGEIGFGPKEARLRYQKFDIPTETGTARLYKGFSIESSIGTRAQPLIGLTKTAYGKYHLKVGTPRVSLAGFKKGGEVLYETSTQRAILMKSLPANAKPVDIGGGQFLPGASAASLKAGSKIIQEFQYQKSAYIRKSFLREVKSLKGQNVQKVEAFIKQKGTLYGSYASQQQLPTDIYITRGPAGDIDVMTIFGTNKAAIKSFTPTLKQIRKGGDIVKFEKPGEPLVVSLREGKYVHAVDIHTKETLAEDVISPAYQATHAYGYSINQKTFKIQGVKTQPLSENLVRKYASAFTLRSTKEGKLYFGPEAHRIKDISDVNLYGQTLARSSGYSPSGAESLLGKFRSFYSPSTFKTAPSIKSPIIKPITPSPTLIPFSPSRSLASDVPGVAASQAKYRSPSLDVPGLSRFPSPSRKIPSLSKSISRSLSPSFSTSFTPSISKSLSSSISKSISWSPSTSKSLSKSISLSPSASKSTSLSISRSISQSISPSVSVSPSFSKSISKSISRSMSPSLSPSISRSILTQSYIQPPPIPPFWGGSGKGDMFGNLGKKRKAGRKFKYTPTLRSTFFGIKGKTPLGTLTGLEDRPIPL